MSLILEALRKSEAERRRGQAPDLLTETAPPAPGAGSAARDWRVIGVVAVAALVAVLLTVAWLRSPPRPEPVVAASAPRASLEPGAAASPSLPGPLQPPRPALPAPTAPARTSAAPAPAPASAAPPIAATPAAARSEAPPHAPDIDTVAAPPAAPPASASIASVAAASNPPAAAAAFASPDMPLRLSDLSTDDRQQLPALKVSMHMWAPEAGNRFAIIDGTRVNEGDRVGDATVEAIQQDAVLLVWRGRRIRLPIR
jgi:general secretion pathway protein B